MANCTAERMRLFEADYLIESFPPLSFNPSEGEAETVKGSGSEAEA